MKQCISIGGRTSVRRIYLQSFLLLLGVFTLVSCGGKVELLVAPKVQTSVLVISHGTFDGTRSGYGIYEVSVSATDIIYTSSGLDSMQFPPRLKRSGISREEWEGLVRSIDTVALHTMDTLRFRGNATGAPPLNEWIEIQTRQLKKRIVFDYGDKVEELDSLLTKMRAIHARGMI